MGEKGEEKAFADFLSFSSPLNLPCPKTDPDRGVTSRVTRWLLPKKERKEGKKERGGKGRPTHLPPPPGTRVVSGGALLTGRQISSRGQRNNLDWSDAFSGPPSPSF